MDILDKFIDLKISGVPRYQDLTTKIQIPLGKGSLSFFSLTGTGKMALLDSEEKDGDFTADPKRENYYMGSDLAASGIAYNWLNKKKLNQKLLLSFYYQKMKSSVDTLNDLDEPFNVFYDKSNDKRISMKYTMSKKFSSRISVKSGLSAQKLFFNLDAKRYNDKNNEFISIVEDKVNVIDGPVLLTAYSQWHFKITEKFSIKTGLNLNYFTLTNKISPEPRLSFNYQINDLSSVYLAYGLHSKTAPLATLFAKTKISGNEFISTNNKLDFSKTQHVVAGYSRLISDNVRFKTECYYQYIYNVPVESHPSSFSLLNISNLGSGFSDLIADSLVNKVTGYNYGIELSLEKYFSSKFYYLISISLFESKYTASDKIERNTEFNSNYIFNALAGKEFDLKNGKTLFFSLKAVFSGGKRYTPIDLEMSKLYKSTVRIYSMAYSKQFDPYYKFDAKVGARFELKRFSHEVSVTVDNFTNHQNVFRQEYSAAKKAIITQYQLGIIPGFYYRVYF